MHDTAYRIGGLVMDTYLPSTAATILEIGALNVNGSLRDHAPRNATYVGLDFEAGAGVDVVITGTDDWQVADDHFDLVMASSVFEHDSAFWRTFIEMCRKTKPGGHIYISAPSNGTVHRYPRDCWRFYPDSGLALEDWARSEGFELTLIESFVADREADSWNDFCAIFRRGPCGDPLIRDFVHQKIPTTNALNWRTSLTINASDETQDMRLLRAAHELAGARQAEADQLRGETEALHHEAAVLRAEAAALQAECEALREAARVARVDAETALGDMLLRFERERDQLHAAHADEIAARDDDVSALAARIAELEADLASAHRTAPASPAQDAENSARLLQEIAEISNQKAQSEQRLHERFREIAGLTRLIQERDHAIATEQDRTEWLRQVVSVLTKGYSRSPKARLGTLLPAYFAYKRQERWLRSEGLFDADEYTATYPEVARAPVHPLRHYINHGMREGRVIRQGA